MSLVVNEGLLKERLVNRAAETIRATGSFSRFNLVSIAPPVGLNLYELEELFKASPDDDGFANLKIIATVKAHQPKQRMASTPVVQEWTPEKILACTVKLFEEHELEKPLSMRVATRLHKEGLICDVNTIKKAFAVDGMYGWLLYQTASLELLQDPKTWNTKRTGPPSSWKGRSRPWVPLDVSKITIEPYDLPNTVQWSKAAIIARGVLIARQVEVTEAFTTKQIHQLSELKVFPNTDTIAGKYPREEGRARMQHFRDDLQAAIDLDNGKEPTTRNSIALEMAF